jgi:integration host factor subunit alpha
MLARMTKSDIVQSIYMKLGGFSKKESADLVDLVFETIKETLGRGEKVKISGFGNFVLRDKRSRQGRNPQTGEPILIGGRRVLSFKASQLLKDAVNDGSDNDDTSDRPGPARIGANSGSAMSVGARTAAKE